MRIAYHIGAQCTDQGRLLKSLLRNADALAERGVRIPGPGKYRNLLRETIHGTAVAAPPEGLRDTLLESILGGEAAQAMVLSYDRFICFPKRVFENGELLHLAGEKVAGMRALFAGDQISYFLGLRNLATYIPAVYADQGDMDFAEFMRATDPETLRWSDVVARIRAADPQAELTVWCNEDTPLIWAQLIRLIAGLDPMDRISGGFDLLQSLLTPEGMQRFVAYLRSHPPRTESQKRQIIAAFLDQHAAPGALVQTIDLPGWDQPLVDRLTAAYDADVARIRAMEGVRFIAP